MVTPNKLYFGDCLDVLCEDVADASVDLIYMDPPFNSKRLYNAFIGDAQWVAFDDTWHWHEAVDDFHAVAETPGSLAETLEGLRRILGEGPSLAYLSYMAHRLRECWRVLKPTGTLYLHCDPTMSHYLKLVMDGLVRDLPGGIQAHFRNEIVWCYAGGGIPRHDFPRKHDVIFRYSRGQTPIFRSERLRVPYNSDYKATVFAGRNTRGAGRTYVRNPQGKIVEDWWSDIRRPYGKERLGYPTQKSVKLLHRLIEASTDPGHVVLDPFCGCGTTIHAAQILSRRWIGIDVCVNACKVIEGRLRSNFESVWDDVEFIGMPKTCDDAKVLASMDAFRFERWAASLVDGMEYNKVQRGDKGIDGRGRIALRKGKFVDIVAQVKSGAAGPGDVQAFNGARQQAGADLGIFTCFEDRVTTGMRNAAASAGRFIDTPAVQIYTIEDYFAGRRPLVPRIA